MTKCEGCKAKITFRQQADYYTGLLTPNATRNRNPINVDPAPNGNILLHKDGVRYSIVPADLRDKYEGQLHVSHHATCPQAKRFGKKKAAARK